MSDKEDDETSDDKPLLATHKRRITSGTPSPCKQQLKEKVDQQSIRAQRSPSGCFQSG